MKEHLNYLIVKHSLAVIFAGAMTGYFVGMTVTHKMIKRIFKK